MFGATNIAKNSDKFKRVYSDYGIAFYGGDWWSFGNGTARNVIIFGVDNSSSSLVDNLKITIYILGLDPTYGRNGTFGEPEKKSSINFTTPKTKFGLSLHYNDDNSYLFVNGKEIIKFKANIKNFKFQTRFF